MTKKESITRLVDKLMVMPCGKLIELTRHLTEQDNEAVTRQILERNNRNLWEVK